jgi:hypothetical protein
MLYWLIDKESSSLVMDHDLLKECQYAAECSSVLFRCLLHDAGLFLLLH